VVICVYTERRWDQLTAAIASAQEQTPQPHQVIVVVDHNDLLYARLRSTLAPDVVLLQNRFARGLSGARNTGVEASSGEVVAFLDDDAAAAPGWLAGHARHYDDPVVVGVGGSVHPVWGGGEPAWFPPEFAWVTGCTYVGLPTQVSDVRNPIGANMSFRRSPVGSAGGFREGLGRVGTMPLGCEETELAIRLRSVMPAGRILHDPSAVVQHHVPADRSRFSYFARRCWAEGHSKALVSQLAGAERALSSERSYVTRTLPLGVCRNVGHAVRDRSVWPVARAATIVTGLGITTAGYLTARLRGRTLPHPSFTVEPPSVRG
jgi:GT2 family glycosyltransferase